MSEAEKMDLLLGNRLRQFRENRGLSHAQLAGKVGLGIDDLLKCEKGKRRVTATELWAFCGVFDVSPAAFFSTE